MISNELSELVRPLALIQKIIWFALTLSIIFYVGLAYFLVVREGAAFADFGGEFELIMYLLAAGAALISVAFTRYFTSDRKIEEILRRKADPETLSKFPGTKMSSTEMIGSLSRFELRLLNLAANLNVPLIVGLALNESVAIFGLVLAFISGNPSSIIPFALVALALNFWMFPRTEKILKRAGKFVHLADM